MSYVDPSEPPEPGEGGLRAKDLKNLVVMLKPATLGEWPAKAATEKDKAQGPTPYVACECWVIESSGTVAQYEPEVRISWWRAVEQLKSHVGEYVAGKVMEQDDRSIILQPLNARQREAVDKAWPAIHATEAPVAAPAPGPMPTGAGEDGYYDEEPF